MTTTEKFMALTAIFWIVFDIYIIVKDGKTASISAHVIRWVNANRRAFLLTFAFGVVCGHLFWNMASVDIYGECPKQGVQIEK